MSWVREILSEKSQDVLTIHVDANVQDAATRMNDARVGALVVVDGERISGIVTERDVLRKVVAQRKDPAAVSVGHVMTEPVICGSPDMHIDEARSIFRDRRIRHLPVIDGQKRLVGMLSIGDINAHRLDHQEATIMYLEQVIYGVA